MKVKKVLVTAVLVFLITNLPLAAEQITVKGSTTVLPISQATAEVFMDNNPSVRMSIQGGGSGVGMASLLDETADIGNASRAIKDKELQQAAARGIKPKAHVVAMDGIAVIVNPSNSIKELTKEQVKGIYTGKISNWSQVGGSKGKIVVVSRDTSSGTYEAFNNLALQKKRVRPDALLEASNQAVVTVVSKTPGAIGYAGLGFVSGAVKALKIEGVECTKETVLSGEYAYSRPLFMYTGGVPKGAIKQYLDFVVSSEGQRIVEAQGYVGLQ
jgi:phosphate transport system substrate-binding protein